MFGLETNFLISQILMLFAIAFDFLSMQFKNRKQIYLLLAFSASLISAHLFLLGKATAGIIVLFSVFRFIVCMFSTNKRYLILFLILNTLAVVFNFSEFYDLIIYLGLSIFIVGNFQKNKKRMRQIMMFGTSIVIVYYSLIFSPVAIIAESVFLIGALMGYYRHYIKKTNHKS